MTPCDSWRQFQLPQASRSRTARRSSRRRDCVLRHTQSLTTAASIYTGMSNATYHAYSDFAIRRGAADLGAARRLRIRGKTP